MQTVKNIFMEEKMEKRVYGLPEIDIIRFSASEVLMQSVEEQFQQDFYGPAGGGGSII